MRVIPALFVLACVVVAGGEREYREGQALYEKGDYLGAMVKWRDAADKGNASA